MIEVTADDGEGGTSAAKSVSLGVVAVNAAPVLDTTPSPSLGSVLEDATNPAGALVSGLIAGVVTDADPGAATGIAVIGAPQTNGVWQYTLNGGTSWQAMGSAAESAARLLPANAQTRVRFVPHADFNGQVKLFYRAWDQTQGVAGGTLNTSGKRGGTGSLSTAFESATLTVTPVNDAPVLDAAANPALTTIWEDATNPYGTLVKAFASSAISDVDVGALKGIAVTAADATHGTWQFTLNGSTWQGVGSPTGTAARLLPADATARVRFIPSKDFNGQVKLWYRAWDRTQGSAGGTLTTVGNQGGTKSMSTAIDSAALAIAPVNDKPLLSLSGTRDYVHDTAAFVLAASAGVSDVDSPNFAAGQLKVHISAGASAANILAIGVGFTVDASRNVKQGSTIIGTLNAGGGQGTTDLIVTFNANATPAVAQALVRSITFKTVGGAAGTRTIIFSLSDGDGGASADQTKTVNVM